MYDQISRRLAALWHRRPFAAREGSPISAQIEELWHRLKAAAQECAKQGCRLNEHSAKNLVFEMAREIGMREKLPEEAVKFYVTEVLTFVRTLRVESSETHGLAASD